MPSTGPSSGRSRGECADFAAVRERPANREVDALLARGHPRRVERAGAVLRLGAPAGRALVRLPVDALLEEEQLDAPVRRGLERLLPAGRRAAAPSRLFLPAVEHRRLLREPRPVEERLRECEQLPASSRSPRRQSTRRGSCSSRPRAGRRTSPAPRPARRRRHAWRDRGERGCRDSRRPCADALARARRCAAGSAPGTNRPGRAVPAAPRTGRPAARASHP